MSFLNALLVHFVRCFFLKVIIGTTNGSLSLILHSSSGGCGGWGEGGSVRPTVPNVPSHFAAVYDHAPFTVARGAVRKILCNSPFFSPSSQFLSPL